MVLLLYVTDFQVNGDGNSWKKQDNHSAEGSPFALHTQFKMDPIKNFVQHKSMTKNGKNDTKSTARVSNEWTFVHKYYQKSTKIIWNNKYTQRDCHKKRRSDSVQIITAALIFLNLIAMTSLIALPFLWKFKAEYLRPQIKCLYATLFDSVNKT